MYKLILILILSIATSLPSLACNSEGNLVHCSLSKEDLKSTYSYQTLTCLKCACDVFEFTRLLKNIYQDDEGARMQGLSLCLSALLFFPTKYALDKLVGTLTLKLARGRVIENRELLGFIFYFEEQLRVPIFWFAAKSLSDAVQFPTAMAAAINVEDKFMVGNHTLPSRAALEACQFHLCQEHCLNQAARLGDNRLTCPQYNVLVNLVFINPSVRTHRHGAYMVGNGTTPSEQLESLKEIVGNSLIQYAQQDGVDATLLWYNDKMLEEGIFEQTRKALCHLLLDSNVDVDNVLMRTLQDIPEIEAAPDIFSANQPIYPQVDLARLLAALFTVETMGVKKAFYSDLDARLKSLSALLSEDVNEQLDRFGLVFCTNARGLIINGMFVLTRDQGIREYIINYAMDWIRQGLVKGEDEAFVYIASFLWWAHQFGLTSEDFEIFEELKNDWSSISLMHGLRFVDIDKHKRFFDVVDLNKAIVNLANRIEQDIPKGLPNKIFACLEGLKFCNIANALGAAMDDEIKELTCSLGIGMCDAVKQNWMSFIPRLENWHEAGLKLSHPRRNYDGK
jgi:hypothetical protein